jgi:hypothetical protein
MSEITKILKVCDIELELKREIITNEANIDKFINGIKALKTRVFDFSTKEGIKEAKELKTEANKFVKELKEFCDPLEADGKKVAEARSKITTTLATGKEAVIDQILAPVLEREEKIKVIKSKLFVPSLDSNSNAAKLAEVEGLKDYKWLAFEEEALQLIEQHKQFLLNEKIKFDEQERLAKEAAEKARIEKEEAIRVEAEAKAKLAAQKEIDEANARAEKAKIDAEAKVEQIVSQYRPATISTPKPAQVDLTIERQKVVHNEILLDLKDIGITDDETVGYDLAKEIVKAIAKGEIRNLKITY